MSKLGKPKQIKNNNLREHTFIPTGSTVAVKQEEGSRQMANNTA